MAFAKFSKEKAIELTTNAFQGCRKEIDFLEGAKSKWVLKTKWFGLHRTLKCVKHDWVVSTLLWSNGGCSQCDSIKYGIDMTENDLDTIERLIKLAVESDREVFFSESEVETLIAYSQ